MSFDITVQSDDVAAELALAQRLTERKTVLPVLTCARLEAALGRVAIAVTDTESSLRTSCAADVAEPGTVLVPAKKLHEMARALPGASVRLVQDGATVRVLAPEAGFRAILQTFSSDDYPTLAEASATRASLPSAVLSALIDRVRFVVEAVSPGGAASLVYMQAALLAFAPGTATIVGTDGKRLSRVIATVPGVAWDGQLLIPRKALEDLSALLGADGAAETADVAAEDNRIHVTIGHRHFASRTVDVKFPAYERIIPKNVDMPTVTVDGPRLAAAVRRVMLVATQASQRLVLAVEAEQATVTMESADVGQAVERVAATGTQAWSSGFDARFVAEFLASAGAGAVTCAQGNERSPAVWRPAAADGLDYLAIIMPMVT